MGALARTLWQIKIPPEQFYPNHLGAQGLHPMGALMRTLWRIEKYPLGDSIRITRGLRGYTLWVRSRAPSSESKYPRAILSEPPGGYTLWVHSRAPSGKSKYPLGDSIQIT